MKKHLKTIVISVLAFPLTAILYLTYVHIVSFLDPVLSIVIGGAFVLAVLGIVLGLVLCMKDFIVSIFKKNNEVDGKGFKKHF
ncbi:hypothetical protein [Peribacillus simplex]|uniref:hypothetical protein n=1 Tax=Peribacillus simplex TaxID=1478 RepID=UPI003D295D60